MALACAFILFIPFILSMKGFETDSRFGPP